MLYIYTIVLIILGLTQLLNFISILFKEKSFIYLPQVIKGDSTIATLKYQAYTQITVGFSLILYAMIIPAFGITNFISYLLYPLITIVSVFMIGHLKYLP